MDPLAIALESLFSQPTRIMTPRIYISCLASYTAGQLHGAWIAADQDVETLQEAIKELLATSPTPGAEEVAIHDYDDFGTLGNMLGEYPSLDDVSRIANAIAEASCDHNAKAFLAWAEEIAYRPEDVTYEAFCDAYQGTYDSLEDYAAEHLQNTGMIDEVPSWARPYFDIEAYARDLELSGDIQEIRVAGLSFIFNRD